MIETCGTVKSKGMKINGWGSVARAAGKNPITDRNGSNSMLMSRLPWDFIWTQQEHRWLFYLPSTDLFLPPLWVNSSWEDSVQLLVAQWIAGDYVSPPLFYSTTSEQDCGFYQLLFLINLFIVYIIFYSLQDCFLNPLSAGVFCFYLKNSVMMFGGRAIIWLAQRFGFSSVPTS